MNLSIEITTQIADRMVSATWIHRWISDADLHLETGIFFKFHSILDQYNFLSSLSIVEPLSSSRMLIDIRSPSHALHQRGSNGTIQKMVAIEVNRHIQQLYNTAQSLSNRPQPIQRTLFNNEKTYSPSLICIISNTFHL
ncbi:hypothetical protein BLNAU_2434 [Blattamonas nauphoetae]|uniref:Uncharacterized protein n=1 Tax=Blattamonas nauphoetae TaxID=2049346 RepID=A0ABQ9YG39_9EUKA|nr:hypothetical protein BLNAU_2434 [Blattamonas nauphoetae]